MSFDINPIPLNKKNVDGVKSKYIYYRFKNEKKKFHINLEGNKDYITIFELKKIILEKFSKDKGEANLIDFDILICEDEHEKTMCSIANTNLIYEGQNIIIEKVPWYKIQKMEEKIVIQNFEIFKNYLECFFCKKLETDEKYFIWNCCGETTCEKCKDHILDKNISSNYKQNWNLLSDSKFNEENKINNFDKNYKIFNCPFCKSEQKFLNEEEIVMPNKRIQTIKNHVLKIIKENNKISNNNKSEERENKLCIEIDSENKSTNPTNQNPSPLSAIKISQNSSIPHISNFSNPHFSFFENAKFFIIKSSNKENIEISQLHNEWATTIANQKKLSDSFSQNFTILIFSANRSGIFQGYAVMKSYISERVNDIWNNENAIKLGGSFSIEWLCSCELPFTKIKNLTNPLNNNDPIVKSRDTQELPKNLGIHICNLCYEQEKYECFYKKQKPFFDIDRIKSVIQEIEKNRINIKNLIRNQSNKNFLNISLPSSRKNSLDEIKSNISSTNPSPRAYQNFINPSVFNIHSNFKNFIYPYTFNPYYTFAKNNTCLHYYSNNVQKTNNFVKNVKKSRSRSRSRSCSSSRSNSSEYNSSYYSDSSSE